MYPKKVTLHIWLKRNYGNPPKCELCGIKGFFIKHIGKQKKTWSIHWANKDNKYRRNKNDFMGLCHKCHRQYDIKYNNLIPQNTFQKGNKGYWLGKKRPDMCGKNNPMWKNKHHSRLIYP